MTNPKDKLDRIIKIIENELNCQLVNHGSLDSTPILEMIRDELYDLENEVNDDWSISAVVRRVKAYYNYNKAEGIVKVNPQDPRRKALSLVLIAMREESNRYDSKSFSFWLSPLWQGLNEARGLLVQEDE